jgi:predicted nucleotide-binding protein
MARTTRPPIQPDPPLTLTVKRETATTRLTEQIQKGQILLQIKITSEQQLGLARAERDKWSDFTEELLARMFTNRSLASDFRSAGFGAVYMRPPFGVLVDQFYRDVKNQLTRLESVVGRLELIPELPTVSAPVNAAKQSSPRHSRDIFIVHGHDSATRETVCRFLEKLDLRPIVLHEQASRGMTVIEKIEAHSDVEFAVVIMTGDDVGAANIALNEQVKPRARQNVVLELGYFLAKVGRNKVCALYEDGVELPSDFAGVVYVSLSGKWQFELAKEIRAAGIDVDLNRL